jgi:hypothetical protein
MAVNLTSTTTYGLLWPTDIGPVAKEMHCIQQGGEWMEGKQKLGAPLFDLYRQAQSILWPEDQHHEWSDLVLKTILDGRITAVVGPKDASKTRTLAKYALVDYFAFPQITSILVSSTDIRSLELRIWGDMKTLFNRAKEVWKDVPGNVMNSLHGIFTDTITEKDPTARDLRKGIICIPVKDSEGQWQGLEKWTGIKQVRRRVLADEAQFYSLSFLSTFANLDKGNFKGVVLGNPNGEITPLDKISEPMDGWGSEGEITKTMTWKNKWDGITVQLYGPDSPAIRFPGKYVNSIGVEYLTNQEDIERIVRRYGKDSPEDWMFARGIRPENLELFRVVTREMVRQFDAQGDVVWGPRDRIKIYAIDASYGGDRCIGGEAEFGDDINGIQTLAFSEPRIIPIRIYPKSTPKNERLLPEDQIAEYVKTDCERLHIPAANVFHDATGRGSLGTAFARRWRPDTNPIEFGGKPTERPAHGDIYVYDEEKRERRLQRCDEHYHKFVSELWYSVRYAIEANQVRKLSNGVVDELCARKWQYRGNKIEVESKQDTKLRLGYSPDMADWSVIILEGARRLGFTIKKMQGPVKSKRIEDPWRDRLRQRAVVIRKAYTLNYTN